LDRFPSIELGGAELCFFVRVPADAGRIENHLRAAAAGGVRGGGGAQLEVADELAELV
jgi:hypothetical protein